MNEPNEQDEEPGEGADAPVSPETAGDDDELADHEDGPGTPPVESQEASQPKGDDQKAVRDLEKKLTNERKRHADRLGDILGDASTDTLPCPLCFHGLMGFVLPGDADTMPEDQRAAALAFMGAEGAGELQPAEGVVMCERCNGFGQLAFPTRNPHLETQTCPRCSGNGYTSVSQSPSNVTTLPPPAQSFAPNAAEIVGPCPLCGAPNSAGRAHFCNPMVQGAM